MEVSKKSLRSFAFSELSDALDNIDSLLAFNDLSVKTELRLQYVAKLIGAAIDYLHVVDFNDE